MKNRMLIGKKAINFIRENPMTIIRVEEKEMMSNIIQNYSGAKSLYLDITELKENARLMLLKFAEEKENLVCLSTVDIPDPILLSRFSVEKESLITVDECANMSLTEFIELYSGLKEDLKNGNITEFELKKMIMENCPIFATLPKNKVMDILTS